LTAGNETAVFSAAATPAQASLRLSGAGNDLVIAATTPGTQYNNVRVELQTVAGLGNAANASYDANTRRLTIQIDSANQTTLAALTAAVDATGLFTATGDNSAGEGFNPAAAVLAADAGVITGDTGNSGGAANTIFVHVERDASTAADVLAALQADPAIAARFDSRLASSVAGAGSGIVNLAATAVASGGAGEALDRDAGLRVVVGDTTHTIRFSDDVTIEDFLNTLNGSPAGLLAQINAAGTGIDIRTRVSGADFSIGENGGVTAAQLGVRSLTRESLLSELNHGRGVHTADGTDFTILRSDGVELEIDISSAFTVGDVIDLINNHPDNQNPATAVVARLTAVGNGIELVDPNPVVSDPLTITRSTLSEAALDLGLIPSGEFEAAADPGTNTLTGVDVNSREAAGAFNTLLRLTEAVMAGDDREITRAVELLDLDLDRVTLARGELGSRQRTLDVLETRLQDEDIELRRVLSEEIEADLVETLSNLTARQTALEASLQQSASILRTSLLDYL
jgi:flagellin-like hook-associated protein FlgL